MMTRIITALSLLSLIAGAAALSPIGNVSAANLYNGVDCSGKAASSAVCQDKKNSGNPISGSNGAILIITRVVAAVGGAVAVIMIILSAMRMVTANGDANQVSQARRSLIYAIIGLLVVALAQGIVAFVIGSL